MSWENDDPSFQGSLPRSLYVIPNSVDAGHDLQLPVQCEKGKKKNTYFNPSVQSTLFPPKKTSATKNALTIMKQSNMAS